MPGPFTKFYQRKAPAAVKEPQLRAIWKQAKKEASAAAAAQKQADAYSGLVKSLSLSLGPELDRWVTFYGDFPKMKAQTKKIGGILDTYGQSIAASGLHASVTDKLSSGLNDVRSALDLREKTAKNLLESDVDRAIKESKGKPATPIVVFKQDLADLVMKRAPWAAEIVALNKLPIEVILSDTATLKKVGESNDDGNLGQKVRDAAGFEQVLTDITLAYETYALEVSGDPQAAAAAEKVFETAIQEACQDAADRGGAELARMVKVRADYRKYEIKTGVNLTLAIVGTFAGAASLGLAPFTRVPA